LHEKKNTVKTWDRFRKNRNLNKRIICTAKILYYGKEFTKSKKNIKQTWNLANEVTGRKKMSSEGIGEIEGCTNDQQKATAFNELYCNIAHNLNDKLPPPRGDFKKYLPHYLGRSTTTEKIQASHI
jgi:hypothetical protein